MYIRVLYGGVMRYVAYYRVSTQKQGKSGLGLDAQRKMVADFIASNGGELVAEYTEVESGKVDARPELIAAMKKADLVGGKLLVGKLDRLSRDLHFITSLQKSRVDFVVCDLPGCDSFTINIYGALAQREREMISARTKAGLQAAKAKGKKLGTNNLKPELVKDASAKGVAVIREMADTFAAKVNTVIQDMLSQGKSLRAIARELDSLNVKTARGGQWTPTAVRNILQRLERIEGN
jgi:DNA invertase Pin-like site-specific DNA recombinase